MIRQCFRCANKAIRGQPAGKTMSMLRRASFLRTHARANVNACVGVHFSLLSTRALCKCNKSSTLEFISRLKVSRPFLPQPAPSLSGSPLVPTLFRAPRVSHLVAHGVPEHPIAVIQRLLLSLTHLAHRTTKLANLLFGPGACRKVIDVSVLICRAEIRGALRG